MKLLALCGASFVAGCFVMSIGSIGVHALEVLIFLLGLATIILFSHLVFQKGDKFDAPHLGLLTLGLLLVGFAILNPSSFKYGNIEVVRRTALDASAEAKLARDLSSEAMAFVIWNTGDYRNKAIKTRRTSENAAREILRRVHGTNTERFVHALQHKGVFWTPKERLRDIPQDFKAGEFDESMLMKIPRWTEY
jgi:hypothetical protein